MLSVQRPTCDAPRDMFLYCHIVAPEMGRCSYNKGQGIGAFDACTQQQGCEHPLKFVAGS
jgi:hypothetical protein